MKVGLIAPTSLLNVVQPLSTYHLILAHKVIHDKTYQQFYTDRSKKGDFIILDNSAIERSGRSIALKDVVLAAFLIRPSVVVLPDTVFGSEETLDAIEDAFRSPQLRTMLKWLPNTKLCVVVHGLDVDDWLECFKSLNAPDNGIDYLGIPMVTTQLFGDRLKCLQRISDDVIKKCHLFGARDSLQSIHEQGKFPFVTGIDTIKPLKLAVAGLCLDDWERGLKSDKTLLDRQCIEVDENLVYRNCAQFAALCNGQA